MKLSKTTPCNLLAIRQPRYKDRTVLLAKYKIGTHNEIMFTQAKHLAGLHFYISGEKARSYPTTSNGKLECYVIPLDDLEPLERI